MPIGTQGLRRKLERGHVYMNFTCFKIEFLGWNMLWIGKSWALHNSTHMGDSLVHSDVLHRALPIAPFHSIYKKLRLRQVGQLLDDTSTNELGKWKILSQSAPGSTTFYLAVSEDST